MSNIIIQTKLSPRGTDKHGSGAFGASRGDRVHNGIDFSASPGSMVLAPLTGVVSKLGYPYSDDMGFRYVEIESSTCTPQFAQPTSQRSRDYCGKCGQDHLKHRLFYVYPTVELGDLVTKNSTQVGRVQDIAKRYPGITNHIHYEVKQNTVYINPEDAWAGVTRQ